MQAAVSSVKRGFVGRADRFVESARDCGKVGDRQVDENHLWHRSSRSSATRFACFLPPSVINCNHAVRKNNQRRPSEPKRRYDDACGTAHALELIGERWALLVLRELMLGPRRFSELRADLPGISANVLTQRLAELEQRGLVVRRSCRRRPPSRSMKRRAGGWRPSRSSRRSAAGRRAARATTRRCRSAACRSCCRSAR